MKDTKNKFLTYKGRPLVRCGNVIYYGNMSDKFVIMMQIVPDSSQDGAEVTNKVLIQLISTDDTIKAKDKIIKKSEKFGLYNAIDLASVWLERALA